MLRPISSELWDRAAAAHLLNRAGFGGLPHEVEELARVSPETAVDRLLSADASASSPPDWFDDDDRARHRVLRERAGFDDLPGDEKPRFTQMILGREAGQVRNLRRWWLARMRNTEAPLQEKTTLFWHDHFATQASKVKSGWAMYRQNQLFRERGYGPFEEVCRGVSRDPAMLRFLDNDRSRVGNPNQNFARELLELFTLGEGNYTERDVRETARAFTGWTRHRTRNEFFLRADHHDDGPKEILGHEGPLDGDDVVRILARRPECPRLLVSKLWSFFVETEPTAEVVDDLAATLVACDLEMRAALERILLSEALYDPARHRTAIKSPVHLLVGTLRALDLELPQRHDVLTALVRLGHELFEPPNVAGWPAGRAWITTGTLPQRYALVHTLVDELDLRKPERLEEILGSASLASVDEVIANVEPLFFPGGLRPVERRDLRRCFAHVDADPGRWSAADRVSVVKRLLGSPEYQLC